MGNGTKITVEKNNQYTTMSNQHFYATNMSLRAKGLLSLILSLPLTWDYSIAGLTALCGDSYNTVKKTLEELKTLGYLEVIKSAPACKNEGGSGHFEYKYIIHENSTTPEKLKLSTVPTKN